MLVIGTNNPTEWFVQILIHLKILLPSNYLVLWRYVMHNDVLQVLLQQQSRASDWMFMYNALNKLEVKSDNSQTAQICSGD